MVEGDHDSFSNWYFSRREIEENSPSRKDGIDLNKEVYYRKSYCTFLRELGMKLKVPQLTIATATVLCHRFFLRQSHAKNDRITIATACMFLAAKATDAPRDISQVTIFSYEISNKNDPTAHSRIKQKQIYQRHRQLALTGEWLVLSTLGFDLNVHHPYKPLMEGLKKLNVFGNARLRQASWNFVNDSVGTCLCLQFKACHIAAAAIYLGCKAVGVKLPPLWWREIDVSPLQLQEMCDQILDMYEEDHKGMTAGSSSTTLLDSEDPDPPSVKSYAVEPLADPSKMPNSIALRKPLCKNQGSGQENSKSTVTEGCDIKGYGKHDLNSSFSSAASEKVEHYGPDGEICAPVRRKRQRKEKGMGEMDCVVEGGESQNWKAKKKRKL